MEYNEISERFSKIGEKVIKKNPELHYLDVVNIMFVASDKERKSNGKIVFGSCEKVPDKYRFLIDADFIIRIYIHNTAYFTDKQYEILLHHELLHCKIETDKEGELKTSCNPHDVEDFKSIIDRYGVDWAKPELTLFTAAAVGE